jgi:ferredoxin-NADP reductase
MTALALLGYLSAAFALQILLAAAFAIWRRQPASAPRLAQTASPDAEWQGWREFRIIARRFEDAAETQCSFALAPVDGAALRPFKPGQFLTFSLAVAGTGSPARAVRCYSMSDTPDPARYRITVKRAIAPQGKPDLPAGLGSGWLHDHAPVGTILQVKAPSGQFVFATDANAPAVFVAGGIGITPILPMLKAALAEQPDQVVHLYYGVRNGQDHAFKAVLGQLAAAHPAFDLHVLYAAPGADDVQGQDYDRAGFISLDLLRQTLPHGRHAFYICGPDPMMKALIPALQSWGVAEADIHRESFGPQSAAPKAVTAPVAGPALAIGFRRSGRTLEWAGQDANLLDFAERQLIPVEAGCRSGSCGTCATQVISGQVRYAAKPDYDIAPGHCLLCVATPATALELDA